jgi:hypothetical protein
LLKLFDEFAQLIGPVFSVLRHLFDVLLGEVVYWQLVPHAVGEDFGGEVKFHVARAIDELKNGTGCLIFFDGFDA